MVLWKLEMQLSEAFVKICGLAIALGHESLNEHEGLCEFPVNAHWALAMNGHNSTVDDVPAFNVRIEFNGWPVGILGPSGGVIAAGSAANEDTFIAALDEAYTQARRRAILGPVSGCRREQCDPDVPPVRD